MSEAITVRKNLRLAERAKDALEQLDARLSALLADMGERPVEDEYEYDSEGETELHPKERP